MPVLVALLRGVNVGRHHRLAMADLRRVLTDLGHTDVRTHLNSGNAVFSTRRRSPAAVGTEIEKVLAEDLSLPVKVIIRTRDQLADVVSRNPFPTVADDPSRYLVTFLAGPPDAAAIRAISREDVRPERFHHEAGELYLWCPGGLLSSRLPELCSDTRLGVATTTRNWNTVTRLLELTG
jgi:uncharacterized protein (DUF1697 family)